jgi:hypothetical protein
MSPARLSAYSREKSSATRHFEGPRPFESPNFGANIEQSGGGGVDCAKGKDQMEEAKTEKDSIVYCVDTGIGRSADQIEEK